MNSGFLPFLGIAAVGAQALHDATQTLDAGSDGHGGSARMSFIGGPQSPT